MWVLSEVMDLLAIADILLFPLMLLVLQHLMLLLIQVRLLTIFTTIAKDGYFEDKESQCESNR